MSSLVKAGVVVQGCLFKCESLKKKETAFLAMQFQPHQATICFNLVTCEPMAMCILATQKGEGNTKAISTCILTHFPSAMHYHISLILFSFSPFLSPFSLSRTMLEIKKSSMSFVLLSWSMQCNENTATKEKTHDLHGSRCTNLIINHHPQ